MLLKGFRDEKTKNKKSIQNFRRIMGKNRAITAKAHKHASLWWRQTESAGSQSNGWNIFRIANWLPVERIKWNRYLFQQYGALAISEMGTSWNFSETLGNGIKRLWWVKRYWLVMAVDGWCHDKGPAWRGKKPAQTLQTAPKKALNAVCLLKVLVCRLAWRLTERIDMIAKWRKRR